MCASGRPAGRGPPHFSFDFIPYILYMFHRKAKGDRGDDLTKRAALRPCEGMWGAERAGGGRQGRCARRDRRDAAIGRSG